MKISIRKFLLVNLLLAITITTTLTAIGNYYLDQKDIQEHLDTLMAITTLSSQALLADDITPQTLDKIQEDLNDIPHKIEHYFQYHFLNNGTPLTYTNKFNFQVWSDQGKLLLHSPMSPPLPINIEKDGFSDKIVDGQDWRVFSTYNSNAGFRTVVAERYNTRNELGQRIAQDDLYIMLLTFPLSGLLIWIIIGKGLDSLEAVAQEVANRAPNQLEPMDLEGVPEEIKPVIDELNKLFERLKDAFEREKRFASDAAHELKTPLAALKAYAQVALASTDAKERNHALRKLTQGVDRSSHIIQQLLTMSRMVPESNLINDITRINLAKLAADIIGILAQSAIDKDIDIALECESKQIMIEGNYTAIGLMLRNLIDNAIRYTPEKGTVLIKVYQQESSINISVIDNGPGIEEKFHSRVFERFFRVLGNKSPGSGLGLAIVAQIATLHQAKIVLKTPEQGKGLQIDIMFPLASHLTTGT